MENDIESKKQRDAKKTRDWRIANPGYAKEYSARYRKNNPEKIRAYRRAWYQKNKKCVGAYYLNWRKQNIPKILHAYARNSARLRKREFSISVSDIVVPEFCPVLGLKLECSPKIRTACSPSLDRVNSSLGYTPSNIRVISWRANNLKSDATVEELRKVLAYMEAAQ